MGTRGVFGFRVNGEDKVNYNHMDSYPDGNGMAILRFLHDFRDGKSPVEKLAGAGLKRDWIAELREAAAVLTEACEGDLTQYSGCDMWATLSCGLHGGYIEFILNSLMCEWGYIINLDDELLEVYQGWQLAPHEKGRYAHRTENLEYRRMLRAGRGNAYEEYYPCALVASWPLKDLPDEELFLDAFSESEEAG